MHKSLTDDASVSRAPTTLFRQLLDGVLVLTPRMSESLRISTPGDVIWTMLAEPITVGDLVERLATSYGISADTVRADIAPALDELYQQGALVVTSPSA